MFAFSSASNKSTRHRTACIAMGWLAVTSPALGQQKEAADPTPAPTFEERLNIMEISADLHRGALPKESDFKVLADKYKVKRIVSLLSKTEQPDYEKKAAEAAGIEFMHFPLIKNPDNPAPELRLDVPGIRKLVEQFKSDDTVTYVHCQKGRDRSGLVNFGYRVLAQGWTYSEAQKELLERGFKASLLSGMVNDLKLIASGLDELPEVPVKPRPSKIEGETVSVDGVNLFVSKMGDGPPLYLLHGGPGENLVAFRPYLDALAEKFTLVYFDQRGCGRSDKPPFAEMYTLDGLVAEVEGLRKALGHEKISLLGQSTGGVTAMRYAMDHRDRVDKLVLVGAWADAQEYRRYSSLGMRLLSRRDQLEFRQIINRAARRDRDLNDAELKSVLQLLYPYNFFGTLTPEGLEAWDNGMAVSAQVYYAMQEEYLQKLNLREQLAKLSGLSVLAICGEYDSIAPPPVMQTIVDGVGQSARMEVFSRSGHFPYVEENQKFIDVVSTFLAN